MPAPGTIAMYPGTVAPEGWALCDGHLHGSADLEAVLGSPVTPNLTGKFIRGAGATPLGATSGSDTVSLVFGNLPSHSHVAGNEAAHAHTPGTSAGMSTGASHGHSGNTSYVNVDHAHYDTARNLSAASSTYHTVTTNEGSGEGADGNFLDTNPNSQGKQYDAGQTTGTGTNHVHLQPAVDTGYHSASHYHGLTLNSVSVDHTHAFTSGAPTPHTHAVSNEGSGAEFPIVPAHVALSFIIKT